MGNNKFVNMDSLSKTSQGSSERLVKYINIFIEESPAEISNMIASMKNNEASQMLALAHSLKTKARLFGSIDLFQCCVKIENLIKENNFSHELQKALGKAQEFCDGAVVELTNEKARIIG